MEKILKHKPIVGCMRWGIWGANFTTQQYEKLIAQCLEIDLNIFDHADIYGHYTTEADFGKALMHNKGLRKKMKLITKTGIQMITEQRPLHQIKSYNTSAEHIINSVDQSLQNFHTDYIDTLLIHRPDLLMNAEEIAETIDQLKTSGKILHFGVSNFTPSQVALLSKYITVEQHQVEISITNMKAFDNGVLDQCQIKNIQAQAWSPWGNNLFSERSEKNDRILVVANEIAEAYNTGVNEILLAFLYVHPANITPVIGTTQFERIVQAKDAMDINLSREDFYKLWEASAGREVA